MGPVRPLYPRGPKDIAFSGKCQPAASGDTNSASETERQPEHHAPSYESLQGNHPIRLLTLHPATNQDDPISCTLTTHNFDSEIPKFTALSYTWGNPNNRETIILNGFQTTVTSNLHAALMHLRSAEHKLIFWIDALCINQNDNVEKSRQVPLMRDVYMVAEHVLAWLGPATSGIDSDDTTSVYTDIVSRQYWTRLWIIQEVILGQKVIVQCGDIRRDWDDFYKEFPRDVRQCGKQVIRLMDLKKKFQSEKYGLDLGEAIKFATGSNASDPRDKVYGVLGMVWNNGDYRSDYSLSTCQVYHQTHDKILCHRRRRPYVPMFPGFKLHDQKKCNGESCGMLDKLLKIC